MRLFYGLLSALCNRTGQVLRSVYNYLYAEPCFRSRCDQVGTGLRLWALPEITGHARITIGNDVEIWAHIGIYTGRILDDPTFVIGDRVVIGEIGHKVFFTVNRNITLENDVVIGPAVQIVDTDAHPRDPILRARKLPPDASEIKATRICAGALIGASTRIYERGHDWRGCDY